MLTALRKIFRGKSNATARPRASRVNIGKRFTLVAETGQGSMSRVYRAVDNESGRTVCLKVQIPEKNQAAAARREGVAIAREMLLAVRDRVAGAYIMPPFERHELALEVVDGLLDP